VVAVVEYLCDKHGQTGAQKIALLEQKRSRRARSRKRFDFGPPSQRDLMARADKTTITLASEGSIRVP
jgi:hypothetical protein